MRSFIAGIFRCLFQIPYIGRKLWGMCYKKFISLNLFKGVHKKVKLDGKVLLELNIGDWIQMNLYFIGAYEKAELQFAKKMPPQNGCFIDIGANIGLYSLIISKLVGENGKVIAFEPFGINYQSLQKNISLNCLRNIVVEKLAVSNDNQPIELYYEQSNENLGMASSYKPEYSYKEKIDAVSIDKYLEEHPVEQVHLIKIDIEGGEFPALLGMKNTLIRYEPVLLVEVDDSILASTPYCKQDIFEYLAQLGYQKYYIDNHGNISESEVNRKRKNIAFIKHRKA